MENPGLTETISYEVDVERIRKYFYLAVVWFSFAVVLQLFVSDESIYGLRFLKMFFTLCLVFYVPMLISSWRWLWKRKPALVIDSNGLTIGALPKNIKGLDFIAWEDIESINILPHAKTHWLVIEKHGSEQRVEVNLSLIKNSISEIDDVLNGPKHGDCP